MAPELLSSVDIREVDLDHRDRDGGDGIPQRERVVGQRAWIYDDGPESFASRTLYPINELTFVIRLPAHYLRPATGCMTQDQEVELDQSHAAVDGGFPCTQKIEIGTVEDEDARGRRTCHAAESIH